MQDNKDFQQVEIVLEDANGMGCNYGGDCTWNEE